MANSKRLDGYEISIEALEEREQGCRQDAAHDPARLNRALECDRSQEFLSAKLVPGCDEPHRRNHDRIEEDADGDGHPNRSQESFALEIQDSTLPPPSSPIQIPS